MAVTVEVVAVSGKILFVVCPARCFCFICICAIDRYCIYFCYSAGEAGLARGFNPAVTMRCNCPSVVLSTESGQSPNNLSLISVFGRDILVLPPCSEMAESSGVLKQHHSWLSPSADPLSH